MDSCKRKITVIYVCILYFSASHPINNSLLTSEEGRAAFRRSYVIFRMGQKSFRNFGRILIGTYRKLKIGRFAVSPVRKHFLVASAEMYLSLSSHLYVAGKRYRRICPCRIFQRAGGIRPPQPFCSRERPAKQRLTFSCVTFQMELLQGICEAVLFLTSTTNPV